MRFASVLAMLAAPLAANALSAQDVSALVVTIDQLPKRVILTLGEFSPSSDATTAIKLRSNLGKPLSIRSISADCGCLRVDHDQQAVEKDGSLLLKVTLASSKKLGRIRRNLRIFFEQEPTSPLDIGLDTLVNGPIQFESNHASIASAGEIVLSGTKTSHDVRILQCEPTRGSCRILGIEQSSDAFSVRVLPLISFGSTHEWFRIHYQEPGESAPSVVDLPLELRCASPLRFFPSIATIRLEEGAWRSAARLVLAPGSDLEPQELQLSIERGDGSPWPPTHYRVDLRQSSAVLYALSIKCSVPPGESNRPTRLNVASPNGQLLATLDFSSP